MEALHRIYARAPYVFWASMQLVSGVLRVLRNWGARLEECEMQDP